MVVVPDQNRFSNQNRQNQTQPSPAIQGKNMETHNNHTINQVNPTTQNNQDMVNPAMDNQDMVNQAMGNQAMDNQTMDNQAMDNLTMVNLAMVYQTMVNQVMVGHIQATTVIQDIKATKDIRAIKVIKEASVAALDVCQSSFQFSCQHLEAELTEILMNAIAVIIFKFDFH